MVIFHGELLNNQMVYIYISYICNISPTNPKQPSQMDGNMEVVKDLEKKDQSDYKGLANFTSRALRRFGVTTAAI